jgi:hypothetical protein
MRLDFPLEKTEALLLLERLIINRLKIHSFEVGRLDDYRYAKKSYEVYGREIRRRLRRLRYEKDIEIDPEMEQLSKLMLKAHDDLHFYIMKNSPEMAERLARLGINEFKEWQDTREARREAEMERCRRDAKIAVERSMRKKQGPEQ